MFIAVWTLAAGKIWLPHALIFILPHHARLYFKQWAKNYVNKKSIVL